ncbi:glycosyltransferase [Levilactobacillus brevis]|uniref:glycosyltransferase n=1 Tax=Levilactobacillus brevis TaxID=1580 RepID=UPI000B3E861B|nr:glycosyltransferase family 2 protein [Levilactobacillus brevis]ARW22632.1 CDP-glycerol glycerophosphotransferase [Levilactobacillus brevis]
MKTSNVVVSVIVTTKNPKPNYLRRAVESILSQTYRNFELLICDDGSDYLLENIVNPYIEKSPQKIELIRNKRSLGSSISRNRLIEKSKGKYLAIMDDDDFSTANRLQMQVNYLEANKNVSFVGSQVKVISEIGSEKVRYSKLVSKPQRKEYMWNSPYINPSVMFRKKDVLSVGGFPTDKWARHRAEDYDLFLRLYEKGFIGINLDTPLLVYTESTEGMRKKRKYKYRFEELMIRKRNFLRMNIKWWEWGYIFKPIIAGLIPVKILYILHSRGGRS